ncbi:hypothetical protein [Ammoniphilus sp. 3BR4]|uniref:hypothetical protein n=1 Tax=Ammoniphilus sp. 3BR4 TaxID=3158265 RepID=UPI00346752B6
MEESSNRIVDLDEILFHPEHLLFFRKKMDDFTVEVFKKVVRANKSGHGLIKTRLENYHSQRKHYDRAFTILEAQGFIDKKEDGTCTPYSVTNRGRQLLKMLVTEEQQKQN